MLPFSIQFEAANIKMSRNYRREVPEACNWHQDQALSSTIYILYQTGPTGFLLKEEGQAKDFKVFLGDVHSCTCATFKKEKDLCKHICWVILKKFRVSRYDPRKNLNFFLKVFCFSIK